MDNEITEKKRRRWEWIPILLAMLLSFFCVFTATAMALMSQPDKLDDASMLPVGTANYGQVDSDKERFAQLDEAIFADATQDSAGLQLTPGSSNEVSGNRKTPIFLAFVTPIPSETVVPSPVVVTMDAPGTAVPRATASIIPTTTTQPTRIPKITATSFSTRFATVTLTPRPFVTSSVTPFPTPSLTYTPVPAQPTATSKPSNPPTPTHSSTATQTSLPPYATATNTATVTATAINTSTSTSTATHTATAVPPTATNTATATSTATAVLPTATATSTATATNTATATSTATATNTATAVPPTPTNTATATPVVPRVLSIALVNADDDVDDIIPGYETMPDGIILDLTLLPTENLNMWVTLDPEEVGRVEVELTGPTERKHIERHYPYTFPGNSGLNFQGYNFELGDYTLSFEPYADDGTAGIPFVFHFTVIRSAVQKASPVLECVTDNGDGTYTAVFGYNNPNGKVKHIPVGTNNKFIPDPIGRGQPEYFNPGRNYGVISIGFTGGSNIVWSLDGKTATGGSGGPPCSP